MKTIFCDIDGTILNHAGPLSNIGKQEVLPGVLAKIDEWNYKSYTLILTTARPESMRQLTVEQLASLHINYDMLIMGLPTGQRIVINDLNYHGEERALGINLKRNEGLENVNI